MPAHNKNPRLGLHYFPDTFHYRDADLNLWLPKLHALGTSWLTLVAPIDRAIPEEFITGLLNDDIQPILQLNLPLIFPPPVDTLRLLLETYSRWGVKYITFFDKPNQSSSWSLSTWSKDNLVERFLDIFIPLANLANSLDLIPVFPPLEPGGDYWDTSFLRASLRGLLRRGYVEIAENLIISAYAWTGNRSLNWGAGGPERWPAARPYQDLTNVENQQGYRIFEWYTAEAQAITGKPPRIIILAGGSLPTDIIDPRTSLPDLDAHAQRNLTLIRLLESPLEEMETIPPEVLACNFWLLSSGAESEYLKDAWFKPNGQTLPIVQALINWNKKRAYSEGGGYPQDHGINKKSDPNKIEHYLLIPSYEWGIADWHLEAIRPFVKKYRPTVGFSPIEAARAKRVTVVGDPNSFSKQMLDELIAAGCSVELIEGDGTTVATKLATI